MSLAEGWLVTGRLVAFGGCGRAAGRLGREPKLGEVKRFWQGGSWGIRGGQESKPGEAGGCSSGPGEVTKVS